MTTPIVRTVALIALVAAQGCFIDFTRGKPELVAGNPRPAGSASSEPRFSQGYGPKPVEGKQPPTRLVARDGTSCVVSEQKYASTLIGTSMRGALQDCG